MSEHSLLPQTSTKKYGAFEVDFFDQRNDIVYHFYPSGDSFEDGFHMHLEQAFKSVLPSDADVRAEYFDKQDTKELERVTGGNIESDSFYVRVVGWADNPMSNSFLKERVFEKLQGLVGE